MGKKHKFDFSEHEYGPEETMKRLQDLDDIIYGKKTVTSILDIADTMDDSKIIMDNGLSKAINDAIIYKKKSNHSVIVNQDELEDTCDENDYAEEFSDVDESDNEIEDTNEDTSNWCDEIVNDDSSKTSSDECYDECDDNPNENVYANFDGRSVDFIVFNNLGRLTINDGIAPTSYSFPYGLNRDLNPRIKNIDLENADSSAISDMMGLLIDYIVTLKHPTALWTKDEFEAIPNFRIKSKVGYDFSSYKFFELDNYIAGYYVEKSSLNNLIDTFDDMNYTNEDIIKSLVSIAYACGNINNAFFDEDDDYLDVLYTNEFYNYKYEFENHFINDEMNAIANNDDENVERPNVMSMKDTQIEARELIEELTHIPYFDDADDFDDDDEDDEDDDEFSDLFDGEDSAKVSEEKSDKVETTAENRESSDDDSLVVNVHRKTDK